MSNPQSITEGATITLAGQTWTVWMRTANAIGLENERGTIRLIAPNTHTGHGVLLSRTGAEHRVRGNAVRVIVDGDTIREVAA